MKSLCRLTLVRRVMLGLLVVFTVVWVALIGFSYWSNMHEMEGRAKVFGRYVAESLEFVKDADQAHAMVAGLVDIQNKIFEADQLPLALMIQLWDKDGRLIYAPKELQGQEPLSQVDQFVEVNVGGRGFYVTRTELAQWTLLVANPKVEPGWAVRTIAWELFPYMGFTFALVSLAMWAVVWRALRPLHMLSAHIAARSPGDLEPTGINTRYAELLPLQQALDDLLCKLRNKVAQETAFVQEAAHELRTPMAVVSAQAHVLRLAQSPAERLEAEQHLDAALARASHLVGQLLQLAHLGRELPVALAPLDLVQDVRNDLAALVPSAMQRSIELGLDAPDRLLIQTERQTFKSIVHNLVGNAIRYVQVGGKVDVSLAQNGANMVLTVLDNGPGIPVTQREMVFERFHRGDNAAVQGAGLGLAIVREACKRLGGRVSLEACPCGSGCQFVVVLPIAGAVVNARAVSA